MALIVIMIIDTPEGVDVSVTSEPAMQHSIGTDRQTEAQKLAQKLLASLQTEPATNDHGLTALVDQSLEGKQPSVIIVDGPRGTKAATDRDRIAKHYGLDVLLHNVDLKLADLDQLPRYGAMILLDKSVPIVDETLGQLAAGGFRVAHWADLIRSLEVTH